VEEFFFGRYRSEKPVGLYPLPSLLGGSRGVGAPAIEAFGGDWGLTMGGGMAMWFGSGEPLVKPEERACTGD
jgi:hypothetical protein